MIPTTSTSLFTTVVERMSKAGKEHRGYVANIEESVSEGGSVVTDYTFEVNTKSDSAMLKEHLDEMEPYVEEVTIFADGAYSGTENQEKAARKNVKLITTDLTGRDGTGDHWGVQG